MYEFVKFTISTPDPKYISKHRAETTRPGTQAATLGATWLPTRSPARPRPGGCLPNKWTTGRHKVGLKMSIDV